MLQELRCDIFREEIIVFHKGLNVILGDNKASNSIGKSSFLMILDFIFGGDTYLETNKDVIENIRHHEFKFCFRFESEELHFIRDTKNKNKVFRCDSNYVILHDIPLDEYADLLKKKYEIELPNITFRAITSPFSRIWGKGNYLLEKPLHQVANEKNKKVVLKLIKLFNLYEVIKVKEERLNVLIEKQKISRIAAKSDYLPSLTKTAYKKNAKSIIELNKEIEILKSDVLALSINLKELVTKEVLDLKEKKSRLVKDKAIYGNKLKRTQENISRKHTPTKSQFAKLVEFFPGVNVGRLDEIERFHTSISGILTQELKENEKGLLVDLEYIEIEISKIDELINYKLNIKDAPNYMVERIVELSVKVRQLEYENNFYEEQEKVSEDIKTEKSGLVEVKSKVTSGISMRLNRDMYLLNRQINAAGRRAPTIEVTDDTYEFLGNDDTGTGKAYTNLLTFDISIFRLTPVPILIHDSLLFKNIETPVVENIIDIYNSQTKQVFIAIDEIDKYNKETQVILSDNSVVQLTDEKTLFIRDWRNKK